MSFLAPPRLLSGVGIHDPADPHLGKGGHVRLFPNPALGLPVAPIVVSRGTLNADLLLRASRHDIEWRDSNGVLQTPPFTVVPGNPVYGYLPPLPGARCIWIQVDMTPQRILPPIDPRILTGTNLGNRLNPAGGIAGGTTGGITGGIFRPIFLGRLELAQMEPSLLGPAAVQARSVAPYMLAASHIARIRVAGSGIVRGVNWLDVSTLKGETGKRWKWWSLPHDSAPRYLSLPNAEALAKDRIAGGAPQREALYDAPDTTPATAPVFADAVDHDVTRVIKRFEGGLKGALDRLVVDLSLPQAQLFNPVVSHDDITGNVVGTINVNLLAAVQLASIDPGMARWLGMADVDPDVAAMPQGTLVLYWIDSWWDASAAPPEGLFGRLLGSSFAASSSDLEIFRKTFDGKLPDAVKTPVNLGTIVPLIVGIPSDRPVRPALGALVSGCGTPIGATGSGAAGDGAAVGLTGVNVLAFARVEAAGPVALHGPAPMVASCRSVRHCCPMP